MLVAFPVFGVVDAVRRPDWAWRKASSNRGLWLAVQILLPFVGTLLYFGLVRPRLRAAQLPQG